MLFLIFKFKFTVDSNGLMQTDRSICVQENKNIKKNKIQIVIVEYESDYFIQMCQLMHQTL